MSQRVSCVQSQNHTTPKDTACGLRTKKMFMSKHRHTHLVFLFTSGSWNTLCCISQSGKCQISNCCCSESLSPLLPTWPWPTSNLSHVWGRGHLTDGMLTHEYSYWHAKLPNTNTLAARTTLELLSPHLQAGQPPTTTTDGWMMA